jgi:hypothetical protein
VGQRRLSQVLVAAAAAGGLGTLLRRRRAASPSSHASSPSAEPLPPLSTQSSPGQIADLQEAYGADMAPPSSDTVDS